MTRVAVFGARGRMGRAIVEVLAAAHDVVLSDAFVSAGDPLLGKDAGEALGVGAHGVTLRAFSGEVDADVVIDFSAPAALRSLAGAIRVPLVSGTTGLGDEDRAALEALSQRQPVLWASNMSVGVNVLFHLAERATRILGETFDAEIVEMHHRQKVDAPSGTAVQLAKHVVKAKGLDERALVFGRSGQVGPRRTDEVGVMTLRGGGVIGEHTLYLTDQGERLELTHRALDRAIFARGAVAAARWIVGRPAGMCTMAQMLGLTG